MSGLALLIANTVLSGIFIVPLLVIWGLSLFLVRRRGDPARIGFAWLKLLFPLVIITLTLYVVSNAFSILESQTYNSKDFYQAFRVQLRTSVAAYLFERWSDIAFCITQVEIGIGFLYILAGTRDGLQRAVRYATFGFGFVIFILSIAYFARLNVIYNTYFAYVESPARQSSAGLDYYERKFLVMRHLGASMGILVWIASLLILAFASVVVHKVRGHPSLRESSVILLVTAILYFIRSLYILVATALWVLGTERQSKAIDIIDPLLSIWPFFVLLVLLFVLGVRRRKGLWTTQQNWMNGAAPGQQPYPPGGLYAPPPPQMGYQAQYPGQPMQYPAQYPPQYQQQPPMGGAYPQQYGPQEVSAPHVQDPRLAAQELPPGLPTEMK